jgi:diadenosine tetraphosphate (Ap4A) HIT family hydrolase
VPHLHWWLTPRHRDDPRPAGPIWENLDVLRDMWTEGGFAPAHELEAAAGQLRDELGRRSLTPG